MLAHETPPAAHAGEDRSSAAAFVAVQTWSVNPPETEPEAASLNELVIEHDWLRVGDVVYVTTVQRHALTDADLNAAARSVIGGAA